MSHEQFGMLVIQIKLGGFNWYELAAESQWPSDRVSGKFLVSSEHFTRQFAISACVN